MEPISVYEQEEYHLTFAQPRSYFSLLPLDVKNLLYMFTKFPTRVDLDNVFKNEDVASIKFLTLLGKQSDLNDCYYSYGFCAGKITIARLFLSVGGNPNGQHSGELPLTSAAENGHVEVVRMLLAIGANPNGDKERFPPFPEVFLSRTALSRAAENGSLEIARMLLSAGADCNVSGPHRYPFIGFDSCGQPYEDSALSQAVLSGDIAMVKLLLDAGADPDCGRSRPIGHCWKEIYKTNREEILYLLVQKSKRKEQFMKYLPRELFLRSIRSTLFKME